MISAQQLDALDPQTRQAVQSLLAQVQQRDAETGWRGLRGEFQSTGNEAVARSAEHLIAFDA